MRIRSAGMTGILFGALLLLTIFAPSHLRAQVSMKPIAVINGDIVSVLDLNMRVRMAIVSTGLPNTPEQSRKIAPQVLRRLIEESLLVREAERLSINITDAMVEDAFAQVAASNNMGPKAFEEQLKRSGILPAVMRDQIKAQIAWNLIIDLTVRPNIELSEVEIETAIEQALSSGGREELRLAELFIRVPNNRDFESAMEKAQTLVAQARQGANFLGLAREFSESVSRQVGGDLGWIFASELDEKVGAVAGQLETGEISDPIVTPGGITILFLMDKRQSSEDSVDRAAIEKTLIEQRVNLRALRIMQQLWQTADIDVRM